MTLQSEQQSQNEQSATDSSHAPSLSGVEELAQREAEFRALMAKRTDPSIPMFYEKLRARLQIVGVDLDQLDYKSDPDSPPPCFTANGADFAEWLKCASVGSIPLRMDMPGEPNYCNDCTPEFKLKEVRAGRCMFPQTRFEFRKEIGESGTVGVSRSVKVAPAEYVVYQEMVVPVEALAGQLKRFARKRVEGGGSPAFRLTDAPKEVRGCFARINWAKSESEDQE
jgi:hypothetical protein